jgi:hypothetical protein
MPEDEHWMDLLKRLTTVVSLALTFVTAFVTLALPRLEPITIVLLVFFVILGLAVLAQLVLHWQSLRGPEQQKEFVRTLIYGVFLFLLMVSGMFARYFWELFQTGKGLAEANLKVLLMPLLVSLMVFYPLWTIASGAPRNFFSIVAAFQNGFFWQTIFSGLKPFTGPGGS